MTLDTSTWQSSDHLSGPQCLYSQIQGAKQCYVGMFSTSGSVNTWPHSLVGHNVILLLEVEITAPFLRVAQNVSSPLSLGTFGATLLSSGPASFSKVKTNPSVSQDQPCSSGCRSLQGSHLLFHLFCERVWISRSLLGGLDTGKCADVGPLCSVNACLQAASLAPAHVFPSAAELVEGRRWRWGGSFWRV